MNDNEFTFDIQDKQIREVRVRFTDENPMSSRDIDASQAFLVAAEGYFKSQGVPVQARIIPDLDDNAETVGITVPADIVHLLAIQTMAREAWSESK